MMKIKVTNKDNNNQSQIVKVKKINKIKVIDNNQNNNQEVKVKRVVKAKN